MDVRRYAAAKQAWSTMNYFAHGRRYVDQPWRLAGVSLPDWLNVLDRRTRARSKTVAPFLNNPDRSLRQLAEGVTQHHADDRWFHGQPQFLQLNAQFAAELRGLCPNDQTPRCSFVGHVAVELLLDAELIQRDRSQLDQYYATLRQLDPCSLSAVLEAVLGKPLPGIGRLLDRFIGEQFLWDYLDDSRLWHRLNQVLRRVGLPFLPADAVPWLGSARDRVTAACDELFPPPTALPESTKVDGGRGE
jgi:hypothetical protein